MITKIEMYSAYCDNCKAIYESHNGFLALKEKELLEEDIQEGLEWCILDNGKTYCQSCYSVRWDEKTDYLFAFSRNTADLKEEFLGVIQR